MNSSTILPPSGTASRGANGRSFAMVLGTIVALLAFVAWEQSFWWQSHEDYRFGWLAPLFVAYALFRNREAIRAGFTGVDQPAFGSTEPRRWGSPLWLARCALGGGLVLFLFGALARANAGASHPTTLAIALGAAAMTLALVYLSAPAGRSRRRLTLLFIYPALVWLITVPMLSSVESVVSSFLLHYIGRMVLGVFHLMRLPIELQGNIFVMPGGPVGLDEACLGLRSITGCLFGGFFLAEVTLSRWSLRLVLIATALAMALITNFGRVLFLNLYAYKYGPESIAGAVHDTAGWSVLGVTALALFGVVMYLERREERHAPVE